MSRPHVSSANYCLQDKDDAGMKSLTLADHFIKAKGDMGRPHLTSDDRSLGKGLWG